MKINNFFYNPTFANYFMLALAAIMSALGLHGVIFESSYVSALYSLFSTMLCWESVFNKKIATNVKLSTLLKVLFFLVLLVNAVSIFVSLYKTLLSAW